MTLSMKKSRLWGPVLAMALAGSAASAAQDPFDGLILYEDLNDYTDVDTRHADGVSAETGRGYSVNILLDEAYMEYQADEVIAHQREQQARGHTEFAAFESGRQSSLVLPWELSVVD